MAKVVQGNEIIEDNWSKNAIEAAKILSAELDELDKKAISIADSFSKLGKTNGGLSAKEIQELSKALTETTKARESAITVDKERLALDKQLKMATDEEVKGRLRLQAATAEQRKELKLQLALEKEELGTLEKLRLENKKLTAEREKLNLADKEHVKRLKEINDQLDKNNDQIRENSDQTTKQKLNIGNYGAAVGKVTDLLKSYALAAIAAFSVDNIIGLGKEMLQLADDAKGVQFAFDELGNRGVDAFTRVKASTRGLLSDLEIKRSLVDFDNFNISLEESSTLFEFLAVRAAQTGKSVDSLKDSLVEGLSKESKLRIDNLGISAKQLNEELEKTPNFTQAVANIAKREIAEAGDILDEAASGQQKLNASLENLKVTGGKVLAEAINPLINRLAVFVENLKPEEIENFINGVINFGKGLAVLAGSFAVVTAAQWAWNVATLANPIGLIIVAVAALSTGIYLLVTNMDSIVKWFKEWDNIMRLMINPLGVIKDLFFGTTKEVKQLTKAQKDLNEETKRKQRIDGESIKIGKELLAQQQEEIGDIAILIDAFQDENTTREEKAKIMAKLKADYPDVIKNIDLENASTEDLIGIKKQLIRTLFDEVIAREIATRKAAIAGRILELEISKIGKSDKGVAFINGQIEDLANTLPLIDEVAANINNNLASTIDSLNLESPIGSTSDKVSELTLRVKGLRKALSEATTQEERNDLKARLDKSLEELAQYETQRVNIIKDGLDEEDKVRSTQSSGSGSTTNKVKSDVKEVKNLFEDIDVIVKDWKDFYTSEIIVVEDIEDTTDAVTELQEETRVALGLLEEWRLFNLDPENQKAIEASKEFFKQQIEDLSEFLQKSAEMKQQALDNDIANREKEISDSESEITRLQSLGTANAAEAIAAERDAINQDKLEIEALQKEKRDLLLKVTALELASSKIQQGLSIGTVGSDLKAMFAGLPSFYEGTNGTLGETLGKTRTKDGHLIWADDKEYIIGADDSQMLKSVGFNKTSDIVSAAMQYQTQGLEKRALKASIRASNQFTDHNIVNELKNTQKAISEIQQTHIDMKTLVEVVRKGNTIKRIDHGANKYTL